MMNYSYLVKPTHCLLWVLCVLCFVSCKKEDDADKSADLSVISGTISNYADYASEVDSIYAKDGNGHTMTKCVISSNGSFKISLPTPTTSNLLAITNYVPSSFSPSNPNTMVCVVTFACYKKGFRTNYNLSYGTSSVTPTSQTTSSIQYIYADAACTATGLSSTSSMINNVSSSEQTTIDLSLVKGWNQIGNSMAITTSTSSLSIQAGLSNKLPSNPQWTIE